MRRAVACLPAPGSANSRTGTSLCDNSRITASTGRMLALMPSTNVPANSVVTSISPTTLCSRQYFSHFCPFRSLTHRPANFPCDSMHEDCRRDSWQLGKTVSLVALLFSTAYVSTLLLGNDSGPICQPSQQDTTRGK